MTTRLSNIQSSYTPARHNQNPTPYQPRTVIANLNPSQFLAPAKHRQNPSPYPRNPRLANYDNYDLKTFAHANPPIIRGGTDTIRGGKVILLAMNIPLDDSLTRDEALKSVRLPDGWTTASVGSGIAMPTAQGLVLASGQTPSSRITVTADDDDLIDFDIAVDVELLAPPHPTQFMTSPASFQAIARRGDVAELRVDLDQRKDQADAVVSLLYTPVGGAAVLAGAVVVPPPWAFTLRIVRNQERVWGFVGTRTDADVYSALTPVGSLRNFVSDYAGVRLVTANGRGQVEARARYAAFTVRSHARIGDRLLDDKQVVYHRQIIGKVPAAELVDVGAQDITVFGPFGSTVATQGFNYSLPDVLTLSEGADVGLVTATDPALFDGPRRTKRRGGR